MDIANICLSVDSTDYLMDGNLILENGKVNIVFANLYNITSVAEHESIHRYDKTTWGGTVGEVKAIIGQTKHESWSHVSENFAASEARYAAESLKKALKVKNGRISEENAQDYINDLNKSFQGYNSFMLIDDLVYDMPYTK